MPNKFERMCQSHGPEPISVFSTRETLVDEYRATALRDLRDADGPRNDERPGITWRKPGITEICIGLEINGYLSAEL